jgi:hypothetical protein
MHFQLNLLSWHIRSTFWIRRVLKHQKVLMDLKFAFMDSYLTCPTSCWMAPWRGFSQATEMLISSLMYNACPSGLRLNLDLVVYCLLNLWLELLGLLTVRNSQTTWLEFHLIHYASIGYLISNLYHYFTRAQNRW